jgi:glycine/D-amino acid oxidase-like deaminating enzyme
MRNGEVSYWWRALGGFPPRRASLPGPAEADVCIVGGGYTGLWTAYYLAGLRKWGDGDDVYTFLSSDETRERINVAGALGGLYAPASARVQPAALVAGLAAAVERRGVTIYEATPVTEILPVGADGDARLEHAWCGVLGVPRDWCASVTYDPPSRLGWAGGYTGHGVAAANLAGRTLADLVAGVSSPLTSLPWVGHRSRAWEPEPARWAGVHGLYALYRLADRLEAQTAAEGGQARVMLGEALGRAGDVVSGIPH